MVYGFWMMNSLIDEAHEGQVSLCIAVTIDYSVGNEDVRIGGVQTNQSSCRMLEPITGQYSSALYRAIHVEFDVRSGLRLLSNNGDVDRRHLTHCMYDMYD